MARESPLTPSIVTGLSLWFALALLLSVLGVPAKLNPPAPQILIVSLSTIVTLFCMLVPSIRTWLHELDLRYLVAIHLSRFVGAYFLVLYGHGQLPYFFAVPAGLGDIAVATVAAGLLLIVRPASVMGRLYPLWNALGLIDILCVVATAAYEGMTHPESMQALQQFPLSLLPLFLVPLIIGSHILIFVRLSFMWFVPVPKDGVIESV